MENETFRELFENASEQAIRVFAENLHHLLMQPPLTGQVVLGWDPGYRNGCKLAVVDATGRVLDTAVVYPTQPFNKIAETKRKVTDLLKKHKVTVISIGNGTASRESEKIVAELIAESGLPVQYAIVSEAGASVYSASKLASEEFPEYDVNLRSAVSIARRLQDPLAELVKIDPKAIGIGQYQHDMPPARLDAALAGVVESYSVHILSKGIAKAGAEALAGLRQRFEDGQRLCPEPEASWPGHGREYPVVKNINEDAGKGVSGEVNGHAVRVGRLSFAAAGEDGFLAVGEAVPSRSEDDLRTRFGLLQPDEMASYVSVDGQLIARIVLRDVPRANAKAVLAKLHELGVTELAMLTGDKRASANIIASEVGIDEVHAGLLPADKVDWVEKLLAQKPEKKQLAFVGDGINDAPVLMRADIGIAMGALGSDAAIEAADIVLMDDDPAKISLAMRISGKCMRIAYQNIVFALAVKALCLILTALGITNMWWGVFADVGVMILAVLNATRMLSVKEYQ